MGKPVAEEDRRSMADRRKVGSRRASDCPALSLRQLRNPRRCPSCGSVRSRVTDTGERQGYVYRAHQCRSCGRRWPSYQTVVHPVALDLDDVDPVLFK
jgi:rubredoxin